jgi:hypothetical protein
MENSKAFSYYTTQPWLTKKAARKIKDEVKERLVPPTARVISLEEHIKFLTPRCAGIWILSVLNKIAMRCITFCVQCAII